MMFRVHKIRWDSAYSPAPETLPTELVIDVRFDKDPQQLKLAVMDQLDREYLAVVESFEMEEI